MQNTYCDGPTFSSDKSLTTKDMCQLCRSLNKKFGDDYKFVPESVPEGGIQMAWWYGKKGNEYKTMRFLAHDCGTWPSISNNILAKWKENEEEIIFESKPPEKLVIRTILKAFNDAPSWTLDELHIIEKCFNEIGFDLQGKMPLKKSLCLDQQPIVPPPKCYK